MKHFNRFVDYGNVAHVAKTDLRNIPKEFAETPAISMLGRLNLMKHKMANGDLEHWILEDFNRKLFMTDDRQADVVCSGSNWSPFRIYYIDVVFPGADSSFLTLLSNKPRLDWGFSFEMTPTKIEVKRPEYARGTTPTPPRVNSYLESRTPVAKKSPSVLSDSQSKIPTSSPSPVAVSVKETPVLEQSTSKDSASVASPPSTTSVVEAKSPVAELTPKEDPKNLSSVSSAAIAAEASNPNGSCAKKTPDPCQRKIDFDEADEGAKSEQVGFFLFCFLKGSLNLW